MHTCGTCRKEFDDNGGRWVPHVNGQRYFFCSDHIPELGKKCWACKKEIQFGEEVCACNKTICYECWKLYYPKEMDMVPNHEPE